MRTANAQADLSLRGAHVILLVLSCYGSYGLVTGRTVMFLSFRTDRSGQTVQTQIRLLLEEQSDQSLHCLQFPLHLLSKEKPFCSTLRVITINFRVSEILGFLRNVSSVLSSIVIISLG